MYAFSPFGVLLFGILFFDVSMFGLYILIFVILISAPVLMGLKVTRRD